MEIRYVVHSVCRSAAAVTRPSLASTRPGPPAAAVVLLQRRRFTTNTKQQSEAAAHTPSPPASPATTADPTANPQYRVAQLRASLQNQSSQRAATPPRPPPGNSNAFDAAHKPRSPAWTAPQAGPRTAARSAAPAGQGPASPPAASAADGLLGSLPSQMAADMERSTGTAAGVVGGGAMSTWNEDEFLSKHYGAAEPELRLRPSTGRTVQIRGNVDLARGLRLLGRAVAQNNMRNDIFHARQHERPALKRKRLLRERWRGRFKTGFRAALIRSLELKGQGW